MLQLVAAFFGENRLEEGQRIDRKQRMLRPESSSNSLLFMNSLP
jgi:hypothetical protein